VDEGALSKKPPPVFSFPMRFVIEIVDGLSRLCDTFLSKHEARYGKEKMALKVLIIYCVYADRCESRPRCIGFLQISLNAFHIKKT
jgi:hypothetical protein